MDIQKEKMMGENMIEHPPHYTHGDIEVIDYIDAWDMDYYYGNIIKYVTRAPYKNNEVEDLKKARQYINMKLEKLEGQDE